MRLPKNKDEFVQWLVTGLIYLAYPSIILGIACSIKYLFFIEDAKHYPGNNGPAAGPPPSAWTRPVREKPEKTSEEQKEESKEQKEERQKLRNRKERRS